MCTMDVGQPILGCLRRGLVEFGAGIESFAVVLSYRAQGVMHSRI